VNGYNNAKCVIFKKPNVNIGNDSVKSKKWKITKERNGFDVG
jgi:hypothetical protein